MTQSATSNHAVTQDGDIMKIQLAGSQGEEQLKASFLSFVSAAIDAGAKKVLIHNHELGHHISAHLQSWARQSLELPLFHSGVDKIAIVQPNNREYFNLVSKKDTARRRYFNNENEATDWLNA